MKTRCGFVTNSSSSSFILKFQGEYNPKTGKYERESGYELDEVKKVMEYICQVIEDLYKYDIKDHYKEGKDYIVSNTKDTKEIREIFGDKAYWDSDAPIACLFQHIEYSDDKDRRLAYRAIKEKLGVKDLYRNCEICPFKGMCPTLTDVALNGDVFIVTEENAFPAELLLSLLENSYDVIYSNLHMG